MNTQDRKGWEYYGQKRPAFANKPGKGQESVWDYPRPPVYQPDKRRVLVKVQGRILADTTSAIRILETASPPSFYIPERDIRTEWLVPAAGQSRCEWKGKAQYLTFDDGAHIIKQIGWSYPEVNKAFDAIKGYISFYPSKASCFVDGEAVKAQPGGFYGGWITSEIVGPVKGEGPETYL